MGGLTCSDRLPASGGSWTAEASERYAREVFCNDPACDEALRLNYCGNEISTAKYTTMNFVPKSLFEQFRRVANVFFLVVAFVSFTPLAPYRAVSIALPLFFVVSATMAKEAVEDWRRKQQDIEVNNRKVDVYDGSHTFNSTEWKKLRVGDIVRVEKDEFFPADLVLISSSSEDGFCFVETMNLDGETNLKRKQCLTVTSRFQSVHSFQKFRNLIKCEDPNEKLYSFIGTMYYEGSEYSLSSQQILLRDSKLRNTHYIYGVVVFTGHDTKVMQNAMDPPSKRSKIEMRMDKIIYILFSVLIAISSTGSIFFGLKTKEDIHDGMASRWYLRPDKTSILFDPKRTSLASFCHFLTGLMLYGCLIPISLYISIEIVKVLQSTFINQDQEMYCKEMDQPARARTSNLNEELGQVDTILSDKTGTLTCNSMEFLKCSIAGVDYGWGNSEVGKDLSTGTLDGEIELQPVACSLKSHANDGDSGKQVKGFSFSDDRLMNGSWVKEPHHDLIQMFFRVLAVCHTAIAVVDSKSDGISYEAESPDEATFVVAARELGFKFYEKTQSSILLREFEPCLGRMVDRTYKILCTLSFSSSRKRMSVVVMTEEGQVLIFCKGADSVIFTRLAKNEQIFESTTKNHIKKYSEAGLRTMVVAYRVVSEEEFNIWHDEFSKASNAVSANRDEMVDAAAEKIERGLILLGATAVEDSLQKGVPECIDKLAQAGIRIWVLTGDKLETAINIGFACHLLRKDMKQIIITLDELDPSVFTKGDDEALKKASHESVTRQLHEAQFKANISERNSVLYALIIDGNSLAFALSKDLERSFFDLASVCASVICCRTSPKQKALVARLVKRTTKKTTLAIGDGANDVGMLQEADVGVGISGVEGMQAVMSSDFAIAQFRYLERLLLVHGHWCYRRIAAMICYFFYKNITFGFTLFCFEVHTSFTAQPAYNDWYIAFYNVVFTSLPVIALGVFDKDVSSRLCLKYPLMHQDGVQNILFSWPRILGWMINGVFSSIIIYYFTSSAILDQAFRVDGRVGGLDMLGLTMYTCVIWTVNCQLALYLNYFTWIQHLFIWGSISFWYVFLVIYGLFPPFISTSAYWVFLEAAAPSPIYWIVTSAAVIIALLPYFVYKIFQTIFSPEYL
ncbi:probable phospholipid-transporting ATPase 8 [Dendrobium catenatum]|uniref:Phospholipid-transporting ATPase n=1 Tax=Dendrobium catenatum TaxID=906689 RepID=A0A2I0W3L5_9ASPA|nr:probable phospholipid-transporting ATPase 8 [Dendrobium catenatum]PKU70255.1 Putative phospholipid-transporting ATPase 8 [Dendrobium catenatum]